MSKFLDFKIYELYEHIKIWHILIIVGFFILILVALQIYRHVSYMNFKKRSNEKMEEFKDKQNNTLGIYDVYGRIKK